MLTTASRLMVRMGLALLVLALLIRPAIASEQSRTADTITIVFAALAVLLGVLGGRVARRVEAAAPSEPPPTAGPRADWVQPYRRRSPAATQDGDGARPDDPGAQSR